MTFDTAKKFIDKLLNNCYSNYHIDPEHSPGIIFDFIGGEPLLNIKLITQICDYFEERLIELNHPWLLFHRYSISSNGTLYFTKDV
jgi:sulfatase maturation enzyme AslB (radical SAM superfamily)